MCSTTRTTASLGCAAAGGFGAGKEGTFRAGADAGALGDAGATAGDEEEVAGLSDGRASRFTFRTGDDEGTGSGSMMPAEARVGAKAASIALMAALFAASLGEGGATGAGAAAAGGAAAESS